MQSFNVAGQGPFPVTIEDFSSRNGLLPVSNVHPLSVTDLLQREDCCCYKREDQLKMKSNWCTTRTSEHLPKSFKLSQLLVVCRFWEPFKFKCERATSLFRELLSVIILHCRNSSESLSLFQQRPQNLTWENSFNFYCAVFLLFSLSPYTL